MLLQHEHAGYGHKTLVPIPKAHSRTTPNMSLRIRTVGGNRAELNKCEKVERPVLRSVEKLTAAMEKLIFTQRPCSQISTEAGNAKC